MSETWPSYPLTIPEPLLRKLTRLQKKEAKTDPLCRTETAICVFSGMGPPAYLTLDGDVFQNNGFETDLPVLAYASEEMIGAYLLVGAWRAQLPELMELLPPPPPGTEPCPECEGARSWDPASGDRPVWCRRCGSRGWTYIAPRDRVFLGAPYTRRFAVEAVMTKKWWQRILPGVH